MRGHLALHVQRAAKSARIRPYGETPTPSAIDIQRSGTRREELLLSDDTLRQVWTMRRMVSMLGGSEGKELVLSRLSKTDKNADFLQTLHKEM